MNIEDLNKTQLLLLTLLVNFVTSIATGVLTVSLLDDNSPTVTQTVNRIVERTVETVSTAPVIVPAIQKPAPSTPTQEELRVAATSATAARTVTIYKASSTKVPLATATFLPSAHAVVAATTGLPNEVVIVFADGSSAPASRSKAGSGIIVYGFADNAVLPEVPETTLLTLADTKQGQSVLALAADGSVVTGLVAKVGADSVSLNLPGIPAGASAVTLSGATVGFSNGAGGFLPASVVSSLLAGPVPDASP